jgi:hypothetical protein
VFGQTEAKKRKAGIEMRRRMTLSLYFGKSYFEPMSDEIRIMIASHKTAKLNELKTKMYRKKENLNKWRIY